MRNIMLVIAYDGGRYRGWQRLKDSEQTIQGKLENVISEMVGQPTEIIGSGRTDAGVHARGQVANFPTNSKMPVREMHRYLNRYLPKDIVVQEVKEVPERFHSRYHVKSKKYVYYVWNHWIPSVFQRDFSYQIEDKLNIALMEEAAAKLIGSHDFANFSSLKKGNKSTERTVEEITIAKEGHMIVFTFLGDGFLYNMVRIIIGSLLEIGLKEKDVSYIDQILAGQTRAIAGKTVPPQGLFLDQVIYKSSY